MSKIMWLAGSLLFLSCNEDGLANRNSMLGNDYRLFQNTPVWNIAEAAQKQDTNEIRRIFSNEKPNLDYQEEKFGSTLLMLTIENHQYNSCEMLLRLGANPDIRNRYNGSTALIRASDIENFGGDNTRFIKLLLAYGADPNKADSGSTNTGKSNQENPLLLACQDVNPNVSPIEKVKVLVEAGANINYKNRSGHFPLGEALIYEHYDVALYLLQNGAEYDAMIIDRSEFGNDKKKVYVVDMLREALFPIGSKKHEQKMLVVDFLKEKGIDYWSTPIPEYVKAEAKKLYPGNWESYLKDY